MNKSNLKLEIHKRVAYEDLHWDCVRERLTVRTKGSGLEVDLLISQFVSNFFSSMKASWVAPADLVQGDNLVAAAVCECHGCDEITIERSTQISIGIGRLPLAQALRFRARSAGSSEKSGEATGLVARLNSGTVRIGPRRFAFTVRSYKMLLLFSALCILLGALFYALAALLVIHGFAVFMQFLSDPVEITIVATRRADIGIALLSFLVGIAALVGGIVKKLFRLRTRRDLAEEE